MNTCILFSLCNYNSSSCYFCIFLMMYGPLALKSKEINIQFPNLQVRALLPAAVPRDAQALGHEFRLAGRLERSHQREDHPENVAGSTISISTLLGHRSTTSKHPTIQPAERPSVYLREGEVHASEGEGQDVETFDRKLPHAYLHLHHLLLCLRTAVY